MSDITRLTIDLCEHQMIGAAGVKINGCLFTTYKDVVRHVRERLLGNDVSYDEETFMSWMNNECKICGHVAKMKQTPVRSRKAAPKG